MQKFFEIDPGARHAAVVQLLSHFRPESALAFCNTKAGCRELTEYLHAAGISALALHGDLEQRDRDEVLVQFTQRSCVVLVATDVAARGLDIADLAVVINVEVSPDQDVHVHRIGRTGRADRTGVALTLCAPEEMQWATQIESFQSTPLQWAKLADYPADVRQPLKASMMTLLILGGKRDKLRPGDVLGALTGEAGLSKEEVGKIAVGDAVSYVAVARAAAGRAMEALANGQIKGKKFRIRMLGVDGQGRPADGGKAEAGIPKPARTAAKPGDRAATGRAGGDRPQRNAGAGGGAGAGSGAPSWSKPQARSGSGSGAPRRDDGRPRTGGPTAQKRSKPAR
jgi:ATP-independent RNA helicase DbpA